MMEIVWIHLGRADSKQLVSSFGDAAGTAFVNELFGSVLAPPKKGSKK